MGLNALARHMKGKEEKIAVVVGTITDDIDNRMCFKVFVNSFIEERELLLSPESFIL